MYDPSCRRGGDLRTLAFLIGFGAAQGQHDAFRAEGQIRYVEGNHLGPAEGRGEADQQQGAIAEGSRPGRWASRSTASRMMVEVAASFFSGAVPWQWRMPFMVSRMAGWRGVQPVAAQAVCLPDSHDAKVEAGGWPPAPPGRCRPSRASPAGMHGRPQRTIG
jgi:hypothetical protein